MIAMQLMQAYKDSPMQWRKPGFCTVLLFWLVCNWVIASDKDLYLVTGDYPPFSGIQLPQGGMTTEITVKAFQQMGYQTNIEYEPWKRGFTNTQKLLYFGTFPYVKDLEREKLFLFSDPLYSSKPYFFTRQDSNITYEKDEDLQGLTACVPIGYSYREIQSFLDKKIITVVMRPSNDAACFRALKKGRADLYAGNDITGWEIIKKTFGHTNDFKTIGKALKTASYYIMVGKQHPNGRALLDIFNQGLGVLKSKGVYQEIIHRHLNNTQGSH